MGYIEVEPGIHLFVEDINPSGSETVVFIHGWPLNHLTFEYQYDVLPQYDIRCVGIDLRGFGASSKPWTGYGYDRMAEDVRAVIDAMNLRNITLAGHSMGGAIAIRYAARFNNYRLARLALLAAAAPSFVQRENYPFGMTRQQLDTIIQSLFKDRPQALADFGKMFFAKPVTPSFMGWFQDTGLSAAGYATIKAAVALRDEDLRRDLTSIRVRTGIFQGLLDKICPYAFAVELEKGIADSTLYRFDYSGHAIYYDELERFNAAFLAFLDK